VFLLSLQFKNNLAIKTSRSGLVWLAEESAKKEGKIEILHSAKLNMSVFVFQFKACEVRGIKRADTQHRSRVAIDVCDFDLYHLAIGSEGEN
jgi:hypothetical protein